jgi:hypothetical protein
LQTSECVSAPDRRFAPPYTAGTSTSLGAPPTLAGSRGCQRPGGSLLFTYTTASLQAGARATYTLVSHLPSATSTPLRTALQRHPDLHIDLYATEHAAVASLFLPSLPRSALNLLPRGPTPQLELHLHQLTTATIQGILARQLLTTTLLLIRPPAFYPTSFSEHY